MKLKLAPADREFIATIRAASPRLATLTQAKMREGVSAEHIAAKLTLVAAIAEAWCAERRPPAPDTFEATMIRAGMAGINAAEKLGGFK